MRGLLDRLIAWGRRADAAFAAWLRRLFGPPTLEDRAVRIVLRETRDYANPAKGSRIRRIGAGTAREVARALIRASGVRGVPLAYLMAAACQESRFDPEAVNRNLDKHPDGGLEHEDLGIAQISGTNLKAAMPGLSDGELRAKAFDAAFALDWMAGTCRRLLDWASAAFPDRDPYATAALAYNKGRTGATRILTGQAEPETVAAGQRHEAAVMNFYAVFRTEV
jgi:hypothetical protein